MTFEALLAFGGALLGSGLLDVLRWQRLGWIATIVLPGSWLPFSLSFARPDSHTLLRR